MTVELSPDGAGGHGDAMAVVADGHGVGWATVDVRGEEARLVVALDPAARFERSLVGGVVAAGVTVAASRGATAVVLDVGSLLVRHEARCLGFAGPLRQPLWAAVRDVAPRPAPPGIPASHADEPAPDQRARATALAAALARWGVPATAGRSPRGLGRVAARLSQGVSSTLDVVLDWAPTRHLTLGAPDRPDLMPEAMAVAADTTVRVLRRFPEQAGVIRSMRFDRSARGLTTGHLGGVADRSAGAIHLNVDYVAADGVMEAARRRAAADGTAPFGPDRLSTAGTGGCTTLDATVAHELWHQLEGAFEARLYAASVELRRGVGEALGVATLEHAIKGGEARAPAAWHAARLRLAAEVSDYATTNATEATAELFTAWFCASTAPVVVRFGQLVDRLIPAPPVDRT